MSRKVDNKLSRNRHIAFNVKYIIEVLLLNNYYCQNVISKNYENLNVKKVSRNFVH